MYGSLYIYSYIIHPYLLRLVKFQNIDPSFLNIYIIYMYTIYIRYISSRELGGFSASGVFNIRNLQYEFRLILLLPYPPFGHPSFVSRIYDVRQTRVKTTGYTEYIYIDMVQFIVQGCFCLLALILLLCFSGYVRMVLFQMYILYIVCLYIAI